MKWQDMPSSSNVIVDPPTTAAQRDYLYIPKEFDFKKYAQLRSRNLSEHPMTAEQKAWTDAHMPLDLPASSSADSSAGLAPPQARGAPGLTLNSTPQLTPQEEYLYQMHLRNAMGPGGVTNFNGSRSTLRQMDTDIGGRTYNLPTVWGGQILSPADALAKSKAAGLSNFPSYSDPMVAQDRYTQMHGMMDQDIQGLSRLPIPMGSW